MATMRRDPYNLNYAEDTAGTFGSGWTPEKGTPGSPQPLKERAQRPPNPAVPAPVTAPVTAAPRPAVASTGQQSPLNILSTFAPQPPNFSNITVAGATPAPVNTNLTSPEPVFRSQPTRAEELGAATRGVIGRGVDALGRGELSAYDRLTGGAKAGYQRAAGPLATGVKAAGGFVRGLLGRSTQAGATNASAAQFQQPTKANPTPVTPTSPQLNIDRSDQALGKFGLSDAEFSRRKLAFAGF